MASDHTRSAILAAAERLYADRGFGDVTLRDIVAEANVNLAAVNYHFGSKDDLIAELFVTRSIATIRESERLTKLSEGQCDLDDVEDVVARVVGVATMALTSGRVEAKAPSRLAAR